MEGKYVKELGEGNITMLMFKYSVPTIFATIINAAHNIVDRIFVGRACGEDAIAAITVCFSPTLLLLAVGMTIGVGTATITSIKLGQKKYDDAEKALGQVFFLFAVFLHTSRSICLILCPRPSCFWELPNAFCLTLSDITP
ncbi:MAG: MATE family efflux transporter [Bacilli bacterium]